MNEQEQITVAEGLQELKLINDKLNGRIEKIRRYGSKRPGSEDEIENQRKYVKEQAQSAKDLLTRYKKLKLAINQSNLKTFFTWDNKSYSIAEAIL